MALTNYPQSAATWYVCNRAGVISGDGTSRDKPFPSIADAVVKIATTNPSLGDVISVGQGHAENVTGSNIFSGSLVNTTAVTIPAGTRIVGEGNGNQIPVLTFTAAGSTLAFAAAGISIENIALQGPQTGTTTVAAMVTITAAYCKVVNCPMQMATSATALCTTGISLSSAANGAVISDIPEVYGTTGTPTSWVSTTGTIGPARVQILRCTGLGVTLSSATGAMIDVSANSGTAPAEWLIDRCLLANKATNSTVVIKGATGCTGQVDNCRLSITNATGAATAINTPGNWVMGETYASVPGKAGLIVGTVSG